MSNKQNQLLTPVLTDIKAVLNSYTLGFHVDRYIVYIFLNAT